MPAPRRRIRILLHSKRTVFLCRSGFTVSARSFFCHPFGTKVDGSTGTMPLSVGRCHLDYTVDIASCDTQLSTIRNVPPTSAMMNSPHRCQCSAPPPPSRCRTQTPRRVACPNLGSHRPYFKTASRAPFMTPIKLLTTPRTSRYPHMRRKTPRNCAAALHRAHARAAPGADTRIRSAGEASPCRCEVPTGKTDYPCHPSYEC